MARTIVRLAESKTAGIIAGAVDAASRLMAAGAG
jgi:hypothetical protein